MYTCRTEIQMDGKKMGKLQKEVQTKLTKGLLDLIVLQFLDSEPMHGYQIITKIRRGFGVYFGPSTVYPLLASLEKKGHVESNWNMKGERPRKVYELTSQGRNLLSFTESSLSLICKKMSMDAAASVEVSTANTSTNSRYQKRMMLTHPTLNR